MHFNTSLQIIFSPVNCCYDSYFMYKDMDVMIHQSSNPTETFYSSSFHVST